MCKTRSGKINEQEKIQSTRHIEKGKVQIYDKGDSEGGIIDVCVKIPPESINVSGMKMEVFRITTHSKTSLLQKNNEKMERKKNPAPIPEIKFEGIIMKTLLATTADASNQHQ